MDIVNQIATSWFGISSGELIIIAVVAVVLLAGLFALRVFLKLAFRAVALGCVTILGVALGLWLLFAVLK